MYYVVQSVVNALYRVEIKQSILGRNVTVRSTHCHITCVCLLSVPSPPAGHVYRLIHRARLDSLHPWRAMFGTTGKITIRAFGLRTMVLNFLFVAIGKIIYSCWLKSTSSRFKIILLRRIFHKIWSHGLTYSLSMHLVANSYVFYCDFRSYRWMYVVSMINNFCQILQNLNACWRVFTDIISLVLWHYCF